MRRQITNLMLALAGTPRLISCATEQHSVMVGDCKVVYGEMGPVAQRWEIIKASATGWEVVAEAQGEEGGVLVLHK